MTTGKELETRRDIVAIRIFHTGDIHIGMRFNSYPEGIRDPLKEARVEVVKRMVDVANKESCDIFVISGDLFDKTTGIDKKTITSVAGHLSRFNGNCVAILPGNHDFHTEMVDLWKTFMSQADDKVLLLSEEKPYDLGDFGLKARIYPAPCHSKHSGENNLSWIKEAELDREMLNIGIAHGSMSGISPDLDNSYFNMDLDELERIEVDLWLMGHTHITYPDMDQVRNWKIYNPGTPEPDGLDCRHKGSGFLITIDDEKNIESRKIRTGKYSFMDEKVVLESMDDYRKVEKLFQGQDDNVVARISLRGTLDEESYQQRLQMKRDLEGRILHLILEDSDLKIRINKDKIRREFTEGSFPEQLLVSLEDDEEALQLAYEIISEVRK